MDKSPLEVFFEKSLGTANLFKIHSPSKICIFGAINKT